MFVLEITWMETENLCGAIVQLSYRWDETHIRINCTALGRSTVHIMVGVEKTPNVAVKLAYRQKWVVCTLVRPTDDQMCSSSV